MIKHPWTTLLSVLITSLALLAPAGATAQTEDRAKAKPPRNRNRPPLTNEQPK